MEGIATNPYVVGAALGITIFGALASTVKYFLRKKQRLYSASSRRWIYRSTEIDHVKAHVYWGDIKMDNVVVDRYLIVNKTHQVIDDQYFVKLPKVTLGKDTVVLKCDVSHGPGYGSADIEFGDTVVTVRNIIIKPREGIAITLIHDGSASPRIQASARYQPDLVYYEPYSEVYTPLLLIAFILTPIYALAMDSEYSSMVRIPMGLAILACMASAIAFGKRLNMLPIERSWSAEHIGAPPDQF